MSRRGLPGLLRVYVRTAWWGLVSPRVTEREPLLVHQAVVLRDGQVLLAVRSDIRGWELPGGELTAREKPQVGIQRTLHDRVGLSVPGAERVGAVEHAFTHRRLRLHVYRCEPPEGRVKLDGFDAHRWLSPRGLPNLPQSAVMRKALELLAES